MIDKLSAVLCLIIASTLGLPAIVSVETAAVSDISLASSSHYDGAIVPAKFSGTNDTGSHGSGGAVGLFDRTVTADGVSRSYKLYVPSGVASSPNPAPMVVYMHGGGGDASEGITIWQSSANSNNFILASAENDWSGGGTWREMYEYNQGHQVYHDSLMILEIINATWATYNVDMSRTWLTGFSDGGGMVLRGAVLFSDLLSVACPHSSAWVKEFADPAWCVRKIPIYIRVGENDDYGFDDYCRLAETAFLDAGWVKDVNWKLDIIPGFGHHWHPDSCNLFLGFQGVWKLPHNYIRPVLSFNSPAQGEQWQAGTSHNIEWWLGCGKGPYDITLEYSTNGPSGPWNAISGTSQTVYGIGQFLWNIPGTVPATASAVLRAKITDSSSPQKNNTCVMGYTFKITTTPVPELSLIVPVIGSFTAIAIFNFSKKGKEGKYRKN
jgi:predicted esterase